MPLIGHAALVPQGCCNSLQMHRIDWDARVLTGAATAGVGYPNGGEEESTFRE